MTGGAGQQEWLPVENGQEKDKATREEQPGRVEEAEREKEGEGRARGPIRMRGSQKSRGVQRRSEAGHWLWESASTFEKVVESRQREVRREEKGRHKKWERIPAAQQETCLRVE